MTKNTPQSKPTRRDMLAGTASAAIASAVMLSGTTKTSSAEESMGITKGRIKQSACRWCYGGVSLEKLAAHSAKIGLKGLDLVGPNEWPILKKHGLICTMVSTHSIGKGLNRIENHEECLAQIKKSIELAAEAGFPNVICFSGNRAGMDDDEGMKNCEIAVKKAVPLAEKLGIQLCMELLNSKVNHKDYMCDRTHWGAELVKRVGSDNFKLLYDIYHMQVQEGDVIATIRKYHDCIGHYHTAGVPGRNEFDENQELNYPAIIRAVIDTGFKGYLGQEFIPTRDPLTELTKSVEICDV